MATYQEQIARLDKENVSKVLVAFAELGSIGDALAILQREKIINQDARLAMMALYVKQHPEIERELKARDRTSN